MIFIFENLSLPKVDGALFQLPPNAHYYPKPVCLINLSQWPALVWLFEHFYKPMCEFMNESERKQKSADFDSYLREKPEDKTK